MAATDLKTKLGIRKLAEQKIQEGKSRQKAYEEIKEETKLPGEDIAKIVRYIPTLAAREKYKVANIILIVILVITVILKVLTAISLMQGLGESAILLLIVIPALNVFLTVQVIRYKGQYYRTVIALTVLGISNSLKYIVDKPIDIFTMIDLGICAAMIGLGAYLHFKLVSDYEMKKVRYKSADGKVRVKEEVRFADEYMPSDTLDGDFIQ